MSTSISMLFIMGFQRHINIFIILYSSCEVRRVNLSWEAMASKFVLDSRAAECQKLPQSTESGF